MEVDVAVVLVALGVARVPEPELSGSQATTTARVLGIESGERRRSRRRSPQRALLGAALAEPDGDERTVGRRLEPVDRDGRVGRDGGGVEQRPRRRVAIDAERTTSENWSAPRARSSTNNRSPRDLHRRARRQRHERGKALVPPAPVGPGIERLSGSFVLGGDPLGTSADVAVFQPPVRIGDVDAVKDVDHVLAPGGRCRRDTGGGQPRPMLGRLPWFALRAAQARLLFLVFFDMGHEVSGEAVCFLVDRPPARRTRSDKGRKKQM